MLHESDIFGKVLKIGFSDAFLIAANCAYNNVVFVFEKGFQAICAYGMVTRRDESGKIGLFKEACAVAAFMVWGGHAFSIVINAMV